MAKLDPIYAGLKTVVVSKKRPKLTQTIRKRLTIVMLSQAEIGAIYVRKARPPKHNLIQVSRELCAIRIEQVASLPLLRHKS